jgi:DNA-binding NtrC family response regulator
MQVHRILIVEDDSDVAEALAITLAPLRAQLAFARSLSEAEQAIRCSGFDLVLSDQNLRGEPGGLKLFELCQRHYPSTRFVLMSGFADEVFIDLLKSGLSCPVFLPKPFGASECRNIVESLLIA